ncbi:MAG: hypothetical protein AAF363_13110 [Bacteroidota bacterium]
MSSHHIIRDEQEPGLIIMDYKPEYDSMLNSLLEWTPIVVVSEDVIEKVLPLNFKVDLLIGEKRPDFMDEAYQPVKFLSSTGNNLFENALHFFIASKQKNINVLVQEAAIYDLAQSIIEKELFKGLLISFFSQTSKINILSKEYSKWFKSGTRLIIHELHKHTNFSLSENVTKERECHRGKVSLLVSKSGMVNISSSNEFLMEEIIFDA